MGIVVGAACVVLFFYDLFVCVHCSVVFRVVDGVVVDFYLLDSCSLLS